MGTAADGTVPEKDKRADGARTATRCDLCAAAAADLVIDLPAPSLGTDGRLAPLPLRKVACRVCGVVRSAEPVSPEILRAHYGDAYMLGRQGAAAEPVFVTTQGVEPASVSLLAWLIQGLEAAGAPPPRSVLEVGCGAGRLLARLAARWPEAKVSGIDLDRAGIDAARKAGLNAVIGTLEDDGELYDLICSVAVIEHLPSPAAFLAAKARRLAPGGRVVVVLPCQDDGNRDVFFWDHLHHFHSGHLGALGARAGLTLEFTGLRHPLHQGFSLHVFRVGAPTPSLLVTPEARAMDVRPAVRRCLSALAGLDAWLEELGPRRLTVYGLGETFDFVSGYSQLRDHPISRGLDVNPRRASAKLRDFPVSLPSPKLIAQAEAILLTFSPDRQLQRELEIAKRPVMTVGGLQ